MWKITRPDAAAVLDDKLARKSLARYFDVMQNRKQAKFTIAKNLPAEFDRNDSLETLWKKHGKLTEDFSKIEQEIDTVKKIPRVSYASKILF
jgi:uncharacterized Fe-S radical SAM superfamily protein PflX